MNLVGCGARETPEPKIVPEVIGIESRVKVALLPRPTAGYVHLSLWIDAGTRDADFPQIATVATWIAKRRINAKIYTFVVPDGIEFSMKCRSEAIQKCLNYFSGILKTRSVQTKEVQQALLKLIDARVNANADDEGRSADQLSLESLLGTDAHSLYPFGEPENDKEVTVETVNQFLSDHFGPTRSTLIAIGETHPTKLRKAAQKAFLRLKEARRSREKRMLQPLTPEPRVDVGNSDILSISLAAKDLTAATNIGHSLHKVLSTHLNDATTVRMSNSVSLRGGALLLIRIHSQKLLATVRSVSLELSRIQAEGIPKKEPFLSAQNPQDAARILGIRFCTQGESEIERFKGPGIGVIVNGSADNPGRKHSDVKRKQELETALAAVLNAGIRNVDPELTGTQEETTASLTAENGARIEIRRHPSPHVAISIRMKEGAGSEPPALHGRTALLATMASSSCRHYPEKVLATRLEEINGKLWPVVDGHSWGLTLTVPKKHWRQALDIALQCAAQPSLHRLDLVNAKLLLHKRLTEPGNDHWYKLQTARLVAEASPGWVAPWGALDKTANVTLTEVKRTALRSAVGTRTVIAVVGDLPVTTAAKRIGRRINPLPKGSLTKDRFEPKVGLTAHSLLTAPPINSKIIAIVAWYVRPSAIDPIGAEAFVLQMSKHLNLEAGIHALWHGTEVDGWGGWAALALEISEDSLTHLDQTIDRIAKRISVKAASHSIKNISRKHRESASFITAQPALYAEWLSNSIIGQHDSNPSFRTSLQTFKKLVAATPMFLIARPTDTD